MRSAPAMLRCFFAVILVITFAATPPSQALTPEPPGLLRQIKILLDQAPDASSLRSIAESVTRGCTNNDARAIAIYNFMQLTHYHRQYPGEPAGTPVLKEIHCYGWSLCGGLHAEQSALWRELGWDWRFVGWNGHTTVEARYDDRWHYLDVFLKFYAWMPDGRGGRTIAGEDDLNRNAQTLIQDAFFLDESRRCVYARDNAFVLNGTNVYWRAPQFLSCGDTIADVINGLKTHRGHDRSEGWGGIVHANRDYSADVNLAPGFSLENTWDALPDAWHWPGQKTPPAHTCAGHKDTRNDPGIGLVLEPYLDSKPARSYANGRLTFAPSLSEAFVLKSFAGTENVAHRDGALVPAEAGKPAWVLMNLASPYLLTQARGEASGADAVEVSVDGGKMFKAVALSNFTAAVKGQLAALVKVTFSTALKSLKLEAVVQNNPGALPYLSPGRNVISISAANPEALGENRLVVTCGYRLGSRGKSFAQLCDEGKEIARQHDAKWSEQVTCVQRVFAARDLPATFTIDCPTPRGRYPVYPRMVFLRREIVPPGANPLPLPPGAVEPQRTPNDELAALPNPFLVGTEPPPVLAPRTVRTDRIPLRHAGFVDERGANSERGTLRWPKNKGEDGKVLAAAVLFEGDLSALPKRGLAAARLVAPVTQAHNQAPTRLGVVFLRQSLRQTTTLDVKSLTDVAGSVILPKQPADISEYRPARPFAVDVTRACKAIASGEATFHGLALRIVPDRGIDDGWTVRCDVSTADPVWLEVDTFVESAGDRTR